jgi:hypothetical protein
MERPSSDMEMAKALNLLIASKQTRQADNLVSSVLVKEVKAVFPRVYVGTPRDITEVTSKDYIEQWGLREQEDMYRQIRLHLRNTMLPTLTNSTVTNLYT